MTDTGVVSTPWWHRLWSVVVLTALTSGALTSCHGPAAGVGSTQQQLDSLTVVERPVEDGSYRRAAFGPAWTDVDGNHCRQRVDVLFRTLDRSQPHTVQRRGRCDHDVVAGTWVDPYTGEAMVFTDVKDQQQAQRIPVDHIVALASSWRYGAEDWTPDQRLQLANDLLNLQPTSRTVNSAKSDKDAAAWRPRKSFQCAYATRYVQVKSKYALAVDRSEKAALQDMLTTC